VAKTAAPFWNLLSFAGENAFAATRRTFPTTEKIIFLVKEAI